MLRFDLMLLYQEVRSQDLLHTLDFYTFQIKMSSDYYFFVSVPQPKHAPNKGVAILIDWQCSQ